MALGPFPELIELFPMVCLHGNHHAVAHAFGTDIVVVDVYDVAAVAIFVIHSLVVLTAKIVVPEFVNLVLDILVGFP